MTETMPDPQAFRNRATLVVQFACRRFRQKIPFPDDVMAVLPTLSSVVVDLLDNAIPISDAVSKLQGLKEAFKSSTAFGNTIDQICEKLQNETEPKKYTWELAADLLLFKRNILSYFDACFKTTGIEKPEIYDQQFAVLEAQEKTVAAKKPDNAKDPVPVSLDFAVLKIANTFNQCAVGKTKCVPLCGVCGQSRATWFAIPCGHGMYCDKDKEECEGMLDDVCTECGAKIDDFVRINE